MTARRFYKTSTALLLAAAFTAPPAQGQVQVQQGGNARDANQQVGSEGINQPRDQPDYAARNLLITGNVAGGRAFRGQINYTNPGAFRGNLQSDSLFSFTRDSAYSALGNQGLGSGSYGDRVIVTRPSTSVPGYNRNLRYSGQYDPSANVLSYRDSSGGLISVTGVSGLADVQQHLSRNNRSLGLVNTPGGVFSVDASPLTGIRFNALDANTGLRTNLRQNNAGSNNIQRPPQPPTEEEAELERQQDRSLNYNRRIEGTYQQAETDLDRLGLNLPEDPLAIDLGTQVQSAMALKLAGRTDNNIPNTQAQSIRERVFGPNAQQQEQDQDPNQPGARPQPPSAPEDPYKKLIADILAQAEQVEEDPDAGSQGEQDQDAQGQDAEDDGSQQPDWKKIFEAPKQEERKATRMLREEAVRRALNMVDEEGNVDFDTPLPGVDDDSELGKLLDDLSYDLPRMQTLAGDNENRITNLMTKAEQVLKEGRYLIAENYYRQVVNEKPKDPLAKAGMIHSQMGAGMIRSAAFNLRGLFSDHPELIALRYDAELMPETERLRWLQNRLQKMIGEGDRGGDPGLVLAYLGYQLEAKPLVEFGLDHAQSKAPRDPLMPLLRRIWIKGETPEDLEEAAEAAEEAAEQPEPAE